MSRFSQLKGLSSLFWGEYRKSWLRNAAIVCILAISCTVVTLYNGIMATSRVRVNLGTEPVAMAVDLMVVAKQGTSPALTARPTITRYMRRPADYVEEALRLEVTSRLGRFNVLGVNPNSTLVAWKNILAAGAPITSKGQMVVSTDLAAVHGLSVGDHLSLSALHRQIGTLESADFEIVGLMQGEPLFSPMVVSRDDLARIGLATKMNAALIRRAEGVDQSTLLMWAQETYGSDALYLSPETPNEIAREIMQDQHSPAATVVALAYAFLVICTLTFAYMGYLGRTKEMAILRAVGVSGPQILALFGLQSIANAGLGWALGQGLIQLAKTYFQQRGLMDAAVTVDGTAWLMSVLVVLTGSCIPALLAKSATISELLQARRVPVWRSRVSAVASHDSIAIERERREGVRLLRLPTVEGLFEGVLLRHPGDQVKAGEVLASLDAFFGLQRKEWAAPVDGEIISYDHYSGLLAIAPAAPAPTEHPHAAGEPAVAPSAEPAVVRHRRLPRVGALRPSPGVVAITICIALLVAYWRSWTPYASAVTVRKGDFKDLITLVGSVRATDWREVVSPASGVLTEILVTDGQHVVAGDPLYRLVSTTAAASLKQAQLDLAVAEANYEQQVRWPNIEDRKRAAELAVLRDRTIYEAERQAVNALRVYAPSDGTVVDLQVSEGDEVDARSPLLAFQALDGERSKNRPTATLAQAQAELAALEREAAKLRFYAPHDGVVETINVALGQTVTPGERLMSIHCPEALSDSSPDRALALGLARVNAELRAADVAALELRALQAGQLTDFHLCVGDRIGSQEIVGRISATNKMRALAPVSENIAMAIAAGAEARVTVIATGQTYSGIVIRRADLPQADGPHYTVEIEFQPDVELRAGMTAQITIQGSDGNWSTAIHGRLEPYQQSLIHAQVDGEVEQVFVVSGQWVNEGQLLARLKNESVTLADEQARLALRQLESCLISAELTGCVTEVLVQPGMAVKQGDLLALLENQQIEASLARARLAVERAQSAIISAGVAGTVEKIHVTRGQEVQAGTLLMELRNDEAIQRAERAAYALAVSEASLAALTDDQGGSALELAQMKVEIARAKLAAVEADNEALTIRAPISGTVEPQSGIRLGEMIHAGAALSRIIDTTSLKMDLTVDELDRPYLKPGQAATVVMNASPNYTYEAQVVWVGDEGQQRGGVTTFRATIAIGALKRDPLAEDDDLPPPIRVGMMGAVTIEAVSKSDVITIPREYVNWVNGSPYVTVLERDQRVQKAVKVGLISQTQVEITGGLLAGDVVVRGVRVPAFITRLLTERWDSAWSMAGDRGR